MAVRIRLTKKGMNNSPCYRLVAADATSPRDGRFIEILGWYDPRRKGETFKLKTDRVEYWLAQGAQLSGTARTLVKQAAKSREPAPTGA